MVSSEIVSHTHLYYRFGPIDSDFQRVVVPCASVLEKCVVMDLKPQLDLLFVSLLPNTEEID